MLKLSLRKRIYGGYLISVVVLVTAMTNFVANHNGSFWGVLGLGLLFCTAYSSDSLLERISAALFVFLASSSWLYGLVLWTISGRGEYQSSIPFLIGGVIASLVAVFLLRRFWTGWKLVWARSLVFTLFLAPVPYGPEGSMMPCLVTLIFPPLVLLFIFPSHVGFTLFAFLGLISAIYNIKLKVTPDRDESKDEVVSKGMSL